MMRRFIGKIWSSSQPTIKVEGGESEGGVDEERERGEKEGEVIGEGGEDGDGEVDMEDLRAIANEREGEGEGGEGGVGEEQEGEEVTERNAKSARKEKKGRKGRSRKSLQLDVQEGESGEPLGVDGGEGVNGILETTNLDLDGGVNEQAYAETSKKAKKSNGANKKRKRKSGDSDTAFDPSLVVPAEDGDEAPEVIEKSSVGKVKKRKRKSRDAETALEPAEELAGEQAPKSVETGSAEKADALDTEGNVLEEQAENEVAMLTKNKSAGNNGRNSRPRKSQDAVVEGGAQDPEAIQDAIRDGQAETIREDLIQAPDTAMARPPTHKSFQVVIPARVEDVNDSAAVTAAHRPLTPIHMGNHQSGSGSAHGEAAAQLRMDSQSRGSADPEDEMETASKKPSRKALGKRKASDVGTASRKKQRIRKDSPAGTSELTSFGFTQSSEPQRRATPLFTPINGPRASILPPSAQPPAVESEANDDSDELEYVVEAPKSSGRKKKRRLPVGDDEADPKTPRNKASRKSNTPKSNVKPPQSRVPPSTGRGRLSPEEVETVASAIEDYRDQNGLTQVEINDLVQKDAKTDGSQLWKHVSEQVPDIPRVKLLRYCRRTFHNFPARAAWTEEHDQELREAYEKYPGRWKQIGEAINRFSEDCRDRWRNYLACGDNLKKNVWDNEEEQRFKEIVQEVIDMIREIKRVSNDPRDKDKSDESLIDWKVVSQKMNHTRSRLQCMNKWKQLREREDADAKDPVLNQTISATWRLEEGLKNARRMDSKTKLLLLYAIRDFGAGREGTIPWKRVQQEVPGQPRKMAMRVAFRQMRQQIQGNEEMKLQDIIDLLIDAYEASVPAEPQGFDIDFERFHSSQKILTKRKKRTSTLEAEAEAEAIDSPDDNSEGPSTITKPKQRPRLSEKYVVDNDQEDDDIWAIPRDEQPSNSKRKRTALSLQARESEVGTPRAEQSTKSKRQKTTSSLQADENRVESSPIKKKRKLRERMKDVGQSQSSQSQERDDRRHSELSDVHTALESLRNGNSRARLAAAKEAAKSKGKPFLSEERVIESDEEELPVHEESSTNEVPEATDEEPQANEDQVSENEEELLASATLPEGEEESPTNRDLSENDEALIANGQRSENEEELVTNGEHSENEDLEADEQEPLANEVEPSEHEDLAANDDEMDLDERDANTPGSEGEEDEMDLDNRDRYTAPGGPEEAGDDDSPFGDEEEQIERHDQESVDSQEEQTKHYDHDSVDLDATQDTNTNGVDVENEHEKQASDAETDFHGCQTDAGSVELDTAEEANYRKKSPSPVLFEEQPPKINGYTNGYTNGHRPVEEEERVSSDDDDMSDIPATIVPKPIFVEPRKKKDKSKSKSKSKLESKSKTKRRPVGFR